MLGRRLVHRSACAYTLVGPPHPISNLRPVLYDDPPPLPNRKNTNTSTNTSTNTNTNTTNTNNIRHPYSLREFRHDADAHAQYTLASELRYKLAQEQLDAFNHNYWLESNTRFEAAKQSVLDSLRAPEPSQSPSSPSHPPTSPTPSHTSPSPTHPDPLTLERALSEFYKKWVVQESARQAAYSAEWRRRNAETILLAARVEYQRFKARISRTLGMS
ncbi:hypothetical protein BJ138DRAFT_139798 [Hygrophoropsis aurantiaca]|uniref:Uncharacterized protein n=1 Tax=Hygrophoropsis aurantiaca TaxID=72124 RepID=A0ACB8AA88_9AGAM|nr:hypothetical protein BJ138DRAFT_139798 [Hygrophoropsis aurantiaca]